MADMGLVWGALKRHQLCIWLCGSGSTPAYWPIAQSQALVWTIVTKSEYRPKHWMEINAGTFQMNKMKKKLGTFLFFIPFGPSSFKIWTVLAVRTSFFFPPIYTRNSGKTGWFLEVKGEEWSHWGFLSQDHRLAALSARRWRQTQHAEKKLN